MALSSTNKLASVTANARDEITCEHLKDTKSLQEVYELLHGFYVALLYEDSRKRKVSDCKCEECGKKINQIHACLSCIYFGCFDHIKEHLKNECRFGMELQFGNVFCIKCLDYVYHDDLEKIKENNTLLYHIQNGNNMYQEVTREVKISRLIVNYKQNCFLNCALRSLFLAPVLHDYFFHPGYKCNLCKDYSDEECFECLLCDEFVEFFSGSDEMHEPVYFLYYLKKKVEALRDNKHHDSSETYTTIIDLLFPKIPSPPTDISWVHVDANSVRLYWQSPKHPNGIITAFYILYSTHVDSDLDTWNSKQEKGTEITSLLSGLSSNTDYYLCMKAKNEVGGLGEPSSIITINIPVRHNDSKFPSQENGVNTMGETKWQETSISNKTLDKLEEAFQCNEYLTRSRRIAIAQKYSLAEREIKKWFHKRRMEEHNLSHSMQLHGETLVKNMFFGHVKSFTLSSPVSDNGEFKILHLPIEKNSEGNSEQKLSLVTLIENFLKDSKSQDMKDDINQFLHLPIILVFSLERAQVSSKINDVNFPEFLDMSKYVCKEATDENDFYCCYYLYAIGCHITKNTKAGGHWLTYCKEFRENRWFKYDEVNGNETVEPVDASDVLKLPVNLLFYHRECYKTIWR